MISPQYWSRGHDRGPACGKDPTQMDPASIPRGSALAAKTSGTFSLKDLTAETGPKTRPLQV